MTAVEKNEPQSGEDRLIARYFRPLARHPGAFGLMDDAAILTPPDGSDVVLKTDAIIGGVHFFPDDPADAIALDAAERAGKPFEGAVALGCVIRGETLHFEIVSQESARALLELSLARRLPIGNGILTVDTDAQAWTRARPNEADKGGDAARAALSLVRLKRRLAAG